MATEIIGKQFDGIYCVSCGCSLTKKESEEGTLCEECSKVYDICTRCGKKETYQDGLCQYCHPKG